MFADKPWLFCYNFHPTSIHFLLKHFGYCQGVSDFFFKRENLIGRGDNTSLIIFFKINFYYFVQQRNSMEIYPCKKLEVYTPHMSIMTIRTRAYMRRTRYDIVQCVQYPIQFRLNVCRVWIRISLCVKKKLITRFFQNENNFCDAVAWSCCCYKRCT